jgi:hypothetical protein
MLHFVTYLSIVFNLATLAIQLDTDVEVIV